jgi:hypothetical protein
VSYLSGDDSDASIGPPRDRINGLFTPIWLRHLSWFTITSDTARLSRKNLALTTWLAKAGKILDKQSTEAPSLSSRTECFPFIMSTLEILPTLRRSGLRFPLLPLGAVRPSVSPSLLEQPLRDAARDHLHLGHDPVELTTV